MKIVVEFEAGVLFQHRDAVFFRATGVDGGFVDDDVAFLQHFADGFARLDERREVGALVFVNRGGYGDDITVAGAQVVEIGCKGQVFCCGEFFRGGFQSEVVAGFELIDAALVDIETKNVALAAELNSQGQADVAETDDGELDVLLVHRSVP